MKIEGRRKSKNVETRGGPTEAYNNSNLAQARRNRQADSYNSVVTPVGRMGRDVGASQMKTDSQKKNDFFVKMNAATRTRRKGH